jgi:hypothetical protein
MIRGRVMSARAMAMRWRWPPENSCGYFVHVVGGQVDGGQRLGHAVAAVGAGRRRVEQVEGFGDRRSTRQRGLKLP